MEEVAMPPNLKPRPKKDNPTRYAGDDTYGALPPGAPSRAMEETYFYYMGSGQGGAVRTLVYHQSGSDLPSDATFAQWIADARNGGANAYSRDFETVSWHKPGYLAFFVDMPGWSLLDEIEIAGKGRNRALYFAEIPAGSAKPDFNPNYSFFNADTTTVDAGGEECELLVVQNLHYKAPGKNGKKYTPRVEGDPDDDYKFDIYLSAPVENSTDGRLYFVVDPGGKNSGPP